MPAPRVTDPEESWVKKSCRKKKVRALNSFYIASNLSVSEIGAGSGRSNEAYVN